jgi:hypothetical protein
MYIHKNPRLTMEQENKPLTAEDVAAMIAGAISQIKIYVVESEITAAQNSVKAIVEQSTF